MISETSTHPFRNVVELRALETNMRTKSSSDSMLMNREVREMNPRYRHLMTVSGETFAAYSSARQITESSPPCCAVGEHMLTSTNRDFLARSLSINSIVDVDINDISGNEEMLATTYSLRRCKKAVLQPYTWLLLLIGWRAYGKERVVRYPLIWQVINILYPIFVIVIFLYTNIMQAITCHGKLDPKTDTVPATTVPATTRPPYMPFFYINGQAKATSAEECSHIIIIYIVPSILHFIAFLYGFHYFRIQENEQLYSLMERVFVQAQTAAGMQDVLIRNSRLFLLAAVIWLIANIGLEILYSFAFESLSSSFIQHLNIENESVRYILIILRFLGLILTQGVNVAVIINYCTQCEMLVMHIRGICLHLHEKTLDIKNAMHEILGVKEFISLLNGTLGKMTALCIIGFTELIFIGFGLLLCNQVHKATVWSYRVTFVIVWVVASLFPIIQAARVSKAGRKLTQISLEMRVFGYQASSQMELDSFILFNNTAKLRAKLFGVAILPGSVVITIILIFFVILLLIITDMVPISTIWRFL
ncbi:uncharacterized protein LOC111612574 isoform X1 [Centruroides sculpturatus]|uniref:uncharacterized protein LOC111612574 isoform X1 n=2 Tax=Centruroides sculpturatus TaxID=218467 RepID=UPI000C6DA842|nr:uncharacterized protein LOC111612574 isoform X1 [Centruroides sculpturatus]